MNPHYQNFIRDILKNANTQFHSILVNEEAHAPDRALHQISYRRAERMDG